MHEEAHESAAPTPVVIDRWEASGGTWKIDHVTADVVRILLCRCDGDEVVDIVETADAATVRWAAAQPLAE